jgi:hypothetical protein
MRLVAYRTNQTMELSNGCRNRRRLDRVSRHPLFSLARSFRLGLGSIADRDPVTARQIPQLEAPTRPAGHR